MDENADNIEQAHEATTTPAAEAPAAVDAGDQEIPDGDRPIGEILEELEAQGAAEDPAAASAKAQADNAEPNTEPDAQPADQLRERLDAIERQLSAKGDKDAAGQEAATPGVKLSERRAKILAQQVELFGEDAPEVADIRKMLEEDQQEADKQLAELEPVRARYQAEQEAAVRKVVAETERFFNEKAKAGYGDLFDWNKAKADAAKGVRHPFIDLAASIQQTVTANGRVMTDDEARAAAFTILTRDHPTSKAAQLKANRATKLSMQTSTPPVRAGGTPKAQGGDPWAKAKASLDAMGFPD